MRAVENRRWLLRATNDGITAAIDPAGRVAERLPMYEETVAPMSFSYSSGITIYTTYGDWFAWGCLIAGAVALLCSQWPHYTPRRPVPANRGVSPEHRRP
jgi:apolipoprotein N-acyltransferase